MSVSSSIHEIINKKVHDFNNEQFVERMASIKSKLKEYETAMDDLNDGDNCKNHRFRKNLKETLFHKLNKHLKKPADHHSKMQAHSMQGIVEVRITPPSMNERLYKEKDSIIKIVSSKLVTPAPATSSLKDGTKASDKKGDKNFAEQNLMDEKIFKDTIRLQNISPIIQAGQKLYEQAKQRKNDEPIDQQITATFKNSVLIYYCSEIVLTICDTFFKDKVFRNEDQAIALSEMLAHICFVILLGLPQKNNHNIKTIIIAEIQNSGLLNIYQHLFDNTPSLEFNLPGASATLPGKVNIKSKTKTQTHTKNMHTHTTHSNANSNASSYPASLEHSLNSQTHSSTNIRTQIQIQAAAPIRAAAPPPPETHALHYSKPIMHSLNHDKAFSTGNKDLTPIKSQKSKWLCCF